MSASRYEKFFKALQRINHVAADAIGPDELLTGVLGDMLDIFDCDRAWLLYPCDPDAPTWRVAMERTRPEWPGGFAMNVDFPMTPEVVAIFQGILDCAHVVKYDASNELASTIAQPFSIKSQLIMAIRPRMNKAWALGIHHCAQAPVYTQEDEDLFENIGRQIGEALDHLIAMRQLRESECYNRMLFEKSPVGLTLRRINGPMLEVNPAFASILGCSIEEAKELTFGQALTEGIPQNASEQLECPTSTYRPHRREDEVIHKDGRHIPVQISSSLIEKNEELYILSCVEDITERKHADQALLESRAQMESLSMFLQSALENERKRIARELHDELGQTMTALHFDLKWLDENGHAQQNDIHAKLVSMKNLVSRTVDSIRRISEDLRPGMLDDLGLAAAIEHHVAKFSKQSGIECALFMNEADFDLDEQVATALFRIVQESLTNVARHSGANHVTLRLQELDDQVLLIVQDNGRGLPPAQADGKKTYGLLGMRERVKMLGGTLDIFNEAGAGARIEACVPKHMTINAQS